jgi:8-oxo-dGTP pyrophosphatase MutT (NUDIX family)
MPDLHARRRKARQPPICPGQHWMLGPMGCRGSQEVFEIAKKRPRQQYAALPLAIDQDGQQQVLLVTSRETGRWIIPKGWAEKGIKAHVLAAREAYEEAGLRGDIGHEPIGRYRYTKWLRRAKRAKAVPCEVAVFALQVKQQLDDWPEKGQRERRWFSPAEAALLVDEGSLVTLLLELAAPLS